MISLGRIFMLLALLAPTAAGIGCTELFEPSSLLNDVRILAMIAEPLEVGAADTTTITPHLYVPDGETPTLSWTACPLSLGGRAGFVCIDPRCEIPIGPTFRPAEVAIACLEAVADDFDIPDELGPGAVGGALDQPLPVQVRLTAGDRQAVTSVNVYFGQMPDKPNRHPVIVGLRADVISVRNGESVLVTVTLDPASVDTYAEEEAGRTVIRTEEIIVEWYATAGRFDTERTDGPEHETLWSATRLEDEDVSASLWVVARDFRGGQAIHGPVTIHIDRRNE